MVPGECSHRTMWKFTGQVPEWSDSEAPVEKVTGVYLYLPVTGIMPAFFHCYFFAPSLLGTVRCIVSGPGHIIIGYN